MKSCHRNLIKHSSCEYQTAVNMLNNPYSKLRWFSKCHAPYADICMLGGCVLSKLLHAADPSSVSPLTFLINLCSIFNARLSLRR